MEKTNPSQLRYGTFLCVAVLFILSISMVSAFEFDNVKNQKDTTFDGKSIIGNDLLQKYKPLEIKNLWGLGRTQFEGYLSQHNETCGIECSSTIELQTGQDGILIDEVIFKTLQDDESWIKQDVRSYQFKYWGSIDDYETQCVKGKEICSESKNGTQCYFPQECSQVKIGSHEGWINYNVGESMPKGTYTLKLDAKKRPSRTVDWVIKTNGEWLESWATWGNISAGDDAEVILNSPIDTSTFYSNPVIFNGSVSITNGAYLTNMSLWTNETGSWESKNNTIFQEDYSKNFEDGADYLYVAKEMNPPTGWTGVASSLSYSGAGASTTSPHTGTYSYYGRRGGASGGEEYFYIEKELNNTNNYNLSFYYFGGASASSWWLNTSYYDSSDNLIETNNLPYQATYTYYSERIPINTNKIRIFFRVTDESIGRNVYIDDININKTNPQTQTWNRTITNDIIWNVEACDSDGDCGFATSNYSLFIDTAVPTITLENPTGTLNYGVVGNSETLNVTFTDTNLDSCWYDYNGTNITIEGCLTGVKNSTQFTIEEDNTNITIYANDSVGNENSEFVSWSYNLTEISSTYPSISVESSTETYTSTLDYDSSTFGVITGILNFNGTGYTGTRTGSGDSAIFSADAIMPNVATEINLTAYWTISLTDGSGTIDYNLTSHNVTVSIINMSLCGSPLTVPFWNFTVLNESNNAEINSTFEGTFKVKVLGSEEENVFSYSDTVGNNSQFDFCISPSTETYIVSTDIKLTKTGYVDKFYNYESVTITNTTREDNLYMLTDEDSTSFIIRVVDSSGNNINEAEVQVQRYYSGTDTWAVTEILTTNYVGEAVGHILSEDADYRFNVSQEGVSIYNSSSTKITCPATPCTVTLVVPTSISADWEQTINRTSTLIFSSATNIFTYTYTDTSNIFSNARLHVYRVFPANATLISICNETKTTVAGVINCDINGQTNGTYQASSYITRTTSDFLDKRINGILGTSIFNSLGTDGVLWSIFIFIAIVMLGITRPSLAIVFGTVGLIGLKLLGIINIGAISIVAVSAIAIILLFKIGKE